MNVKTAELIEARVRVTNETETERLHDIGAEAHFSGGQCSSVISGSIAAREDGAVLAQFNTYAPDGELGITFSTTAGRAALMGEAEDFIASVVAMTPQEVFPETGSGE